MRTSETLGSGDLLTELVRRARTDSTTVIWVTFADSEGRALLDRLMGLVQLEPGDRLYRSFGRLGFHHRDGGRVLFRSVRDLRGYSADVVVVPTNLSGAALDNAMVVANGAEVLTWDPEATR